MHLVVGAVIVGLVLLTPGVRDPTADRLAGHPRPWLEKAHNFGVVRDGVFRSRAPSRRFLEYVRDRHGVKTLVDLRDPRSRRQAARMRREQRWAADLGLRYIHHKLLLPPHGDADAVIDMVGALVGSGAGPVLIHCQAGKDRTGSVVALWRLRDGLSYAAAREEMLRYRHRPALDEALHRYLQARFAAR